MRAIFGMLMAVALGMAGAVRAQAPGATIPPVLREWSAWVLHGHERETCPNVRGADERTVCTWPGELALEVDADGARFRQEWDVAVADFVPLPGDAQWRPEDVEVDGRAAPVLLRGGMPMLHLQAGIHRLSGRIVWNQRPASLPVPLSVALVSLRVDGRALPAVQRDDGGAAILGESASYEADSLHVDVARLLHDDLPATLTTWMRLSVAGRPREINLGKVLPQGYTVLALGGDLTARMQADGALVVQAPPGEWEVWLVARAAGALSTLQVPALPEPWPQQEVLQFAGVPRFRIAQLEGLPAVDPEQVVLPGDWSNAGDALFPTVSELAQRYVGEREWPTYLIAPGDTAKVVERQRGLPQSRPPQLVLARSLWLDFDGAGYSVSDRISGDIGSLRRLDMAEPWQLQSVRGEERQQLVTHGDGADRSGVEVREQEAALLAQARVAVGSAGSGWTQPFDSAGFVLNLPPGYRLLGASGAERAYGSWWDAWSLLDLFLGSLLVLLGWRLGGWRAAGLLFAYVLLVWHEPAAPRVTLLVALALAVALTLLAPGRWRDCTAWLQRALLLGIVLLGLPFAATQLRLAMHPQLERWAVQLGEAGSSGELRGRVAQEPAVAFEAPLPMAVEAPPAPEAQDALREQMDASAPASAPPKRPAYEGKANDELEGVMVTGSHIRLQDVFQYPADAIPQAGLAMPAWTWRQYTLSWAGPLLPEDDLGVWLSPPWATALWRLASVLLLAALLWRLLRALPAWPPAARANVATPGAGATALLLPLVLAASLALPRAALAQTAIPDPALLEQLRARLLERDPRCGDDCLGVGPVQVRALGAELEVAMQVQALADGVLSLPRPDGATLVAVSMDARAVPVRDAAGIARMRVGTGMHALLARYRLGGARVALRFELPPTRVSVQAPGFEIAGLDRGRLVGNTLSLTPPLAAADTHDDQRNSVAAPPFVQVVREFTFDREWIVDTQVLRLAPTEAGFSIAVPLLTGEQVIGEAPPIAGGVAQVAMPGGANVVRWQGRLVPAASLSLQATERVDMVERWQVVASPLMHVEVQGVPLSLNGAGEIDAEGRWYFLPLPGERLELTVSRPEAIKGNDQVIEDVELLSTPGNRASDHRLSFSLRATRAGELRLPLPQGAQLQSLQVDDQEFPLLLSAGTVTVPVRVGAQRLQVAWRESVERGFALRTPALELGRSTADIRLSLALPDDRWLLLTAGPQIGPAVLLWSELALLALLAPVLGRWGGTPLRWPQWLLLGLGFATVSWWAAALVAGWLLALGQRARHRIDAAHPLRFDLVQVALAVLSAVALLSLVRAVPAGLLGQPDMGVVGNGSSANLLQWFHDRSADGRLPVASAWTLPLWAYKAAVLAWALWLANALLGWLRWGWRCFNRGGVWLAWRRIKATSADEVAHD